MHNQTTYNFIEIAGGNILFRMAVPIIKVWRLLTTDNTNWQDRNNNEAENILRIFHRLEYLRWQYTYNSDVSLSIL
jgi:hypothetical protein